jgi:short subunit dehydrogenase-like uncharacterized protein
MPESPRVVIFGATGFTGRLVARSAEVRGLPRLLAGRDRARLEEIAGKTGAPPIGLADASDPAALTRLLVRGDVVVNCVGPFTDLGEAVVRACIDAGAHYLDITGEQRFMERVDARHATAARDAGTTVVNAMAFEYALGDCGAAVLARRLRAPLRALAVTYAWEGAAQGASRGTRRSAIRILARRGFRLRDGQRERESPAGRSRSVLLPSGKRQTAVSFPSGEALTVPRHLEVDDVSGWMVVGRRTAGLGRVLSPALPTLLRLGRPLLDHLLAGSPEGPYDETRRGSGFTILLEAESRTGARGRLALTGTDPYGLTAEIVLLAAERLLAVPVPAAGVLSPSQLMEPRAFLSALEPHGVTELDLSSF